MRQAMAVRRWLAVGLVAGAIASPALAAQPRIDTASLLPEMTDLSILARLPDPPYVTKQFSSYDRASKTPADAKAWFANGDAAQYLRTETNAGRKEWVMADTDGPGAVVRIWSANPAGTLRIYLDGSNTPVIEGKMIDVLGGKYPGLPAPLSAEASRGWNLYFPIPYARHCKITSDNGDFYYHVNYRTYPAGAPVTTFTPDLLKSLAPQIADVAKALATPPDPAPGPNTQSFSLGKGSEGETAIAGPAVINRLAIKLTKGDPETALRGTLLTITFDDETTVTAPLGDFFGAAPGINPYQSLPVTVTRDGQFVSRWPMPFKKRAVLRFRNHSPSDVAFEIRTTTEPHAWDDQRSMYFHAKWRVANNLPTRPMTDWNYLTATGAGRFVGASFTIDNPTKAWWGEGDEKIYVDGESFPSHFGTGTEDYYGYAWCDPTPFTHAYHNQPRCDGPGNYGRTSVNRWDVLDSIPFTKSFKFDMEIWHWKQCKVNAAVTAYWYATPGSTDAFPPIKPEQLVVAPLPAYAPTKVAGAIEGEAMRIVSKTGTPAPQDWDGLSDERQLWWHGNPKVGDTLVLAFPVEKPGTYRVKGRFLKAKDYGIVRLAINGRNAGEPIDFYNDGVTPTDEIDLGTFDLKAGDNELAATIVGANPKAVKSHMFGLDYLKLEPATSARRAD